MKRSTWQWPVALLLSVAATWIVYALPLQTALRPFIVLWFLAVCPGMTLVRFLRLPGTITRWTLAVAVSLMLEALLTSVQLYSGHWSPTFALATVSALCVIGAVVQLCIPGLTWDITWPSARTQ
jgi:hypothetical protein